MQSAFPRPLPIATLRRGLPPLGRPQAAALLAALATSLVLGYVTVVRLTAPPAVEVQTTRPSRGPIAATISGTGSVVANTSSKLSFAGQGSVAEVLVQVGDQVEAGQPLARLNTRDLDAQYAKDQASLIQAEAKLQTILSGARPDDVAAARAQLAQAEAHLRDLTTPRDEDVAVARGNLAQAQAKLDGLLNGRAEDVAGAQAQLDAAVAKLRGMEAQGRAEDVAAAQAALDSAQAKLQQTRNGALPADLAAARTAADSARATLQSAEVKLAQVQAGPTDADVQAAVAGLASARATLESAEVKLRELQEP